MYLFVGLRTPELRDWLRGRPSRLAERLSMATVFGDPLLLRSADEELPNSPRLAAYSPPEFTEPLFALGVAAQDSTDLIHVESVQDGRAGHFHAREMTRRQLIDEINRSGSGATITARDACKVDPRLASRLEPKILVRPGAVLVSFGPLNLGAIVLRGMLYLLASKSTNSLLCTVKQDLRRLRDEKNTSPGVDAEGLQGATRETRANAEVPTVPAATATTRAPIVSDGAGVVTNTDESSSEDSSVFNSKRPSESCIDCVSGRPCRSRGITRS